MLRLLSPLRTGWCRDDARAFKNLKVRYNPGMDPVLQFDNEKGIENEDKVWPPPTSPKLPPFPHGIKMSARMPCGIRDGEKRQARGRCSRAWVDVCR